MRIEDKIDKYLNEAIDSDVEELIRDHLYGTDRKVTKASLLTVINNNFKNFKSAKVSKKQFEKIFNNLVNDDYLVKTTDGKYTWEM